MQHGKVHCWQGARKQTFIKIQITSANKEEIELLCIDLHTLQALLQTIGQIASTHGQYKRSPDAMFKAFVSAGLK